MMQNMVVSGTGLEFANQYLKGILRSFAIVIYGVLFLPLHDFIILPTYN